MSDPTSAALLNASRLAVLNETDLLDATGEGVFDDLVEVAARALRAPIAAVTLLDARREVLLSSRGFPEPWASSHAVPLSHSFCKHMLGTGEPLVVTDARDDERVANSPAGKEMRVIAYAGIPIKAPHGELLGGLCAIDHAPRLWTPEEIRILEHVAAAVTQGVHARLVLRRSFDRADSATIFRSLVEHSLAGIYLIQGDRFRYVNPQFAAVFGYTPEELADRRHPLDVVAESDRRSIVQVRERLLSGREPVVHYGFRGLRKDGSLLDLEVHATRAEIGGDPAIVGTLLDRTEQHQAEEMLRSSERHFRSLIENSWDVVYEIDPGGHIRYISPSVEKLLGYKPAELIGTDSVGIVHPDDAAKVRARLEKATFQPGPAPPLELRLVHRDGSERFVEAVGQVFSGAGGEPVLVVNTHDITARKQTETALRASEERYRLVSQATNDVILDWDVVTGSVFWTGAGPQMLRYTDEQVGGTMDWLHERVHPDDREKVVREQHSVVQGLTSYWSGEYRFLRGDGRYVIVLHRGYVVRDDSGTALRMIGSLMDVTERRKTEEGQRFLARASALLDASLDYESTLASLARLAVPTLADYCLVDLLLEDGMIHRVGVSHHDRGKEHLLLRDQRTPAEADPEKHPVAKVVQTGKPVFVPDCSEDILDQISHDAEHRRGLQTLGLQSFMVVPLVGHEQTLGAITLAASDSGRRYQLVDLVVAQDLARRAAFAIEHARLYRNVQRAVSDREEMLAFVSHDLRNPLNTIRMAATLLLDTLGERGSENRRWVETIERASGQMNTLINDLFAVSRIESGRFPLQKARHEISELLDAGFELLQPLANARSIKLVRAVATGLPAVWIDLHQMLRVLSNLIGNAIKFASEGGSVQVRAERKGAEVQLCVADDGPGIPEEQLSHVVDRYWQARHGDRRGAGLGLAIARGIAEAHGGRIWVESAAGSGASFYVAIPIPEAGDS